MDPDRNLARSEIRLNLVRKPARPDVIDRHGERFRAQFRRKSCLLARSCAIDQVITGFI
jgi:hypothetical protein